MIVWHQCHVQRMRLNLKMIETTVGKVPSRDVILRCRKSILETMVFPEQKQQQRYIMEHVSQKRSYVSGDEYEMACLQIIFILKSCGNANIFWQRAFQRARRCPPEALSNRNCRDAFGKIPIIGMYHKLKNHCCSATLAYIQHSRQVRKGSKAVTTALQKSPFSTMSSRDSIGNIQRIPFNIILQSRLITFSTTV